jgi:hypothetical protein
MGNDSAVMATCTCAVPVPTTPPGRKGASARTQCATCGLPIRIDFG